MCNRKGAKAAVSAICIFLISSGLCSCGYNKNDGGDTVVFHTHEFQLFDIIYPTCDETGKIIYKCYCGEMQEEVTDPLGHTFIHFRPNGDGTETAMCERCTQTFTRNAEDTEKHNLIFHPDIEPTCEQDGRTDYVTCADCDYTAFVIVPALGHEFKDYVYNNDATCSANGTETAKCIRCSKIDTREKADSKLPHNVIEHSGKPASCEESGWEDYETCKECDHTTYQEIPALGHEYENGVCVRCDLADNTCITMNDGVIIRMGAVFRDAKKIVIEADGISEIGELAMRGLQAEEIILPQGIKKVGESAFEYCENVKAIEFTEVEEIADKAFFGCESLTEVKLPATLQSLGNNIFMYCNYELTVYYGGTREQWNSIAPNSLGHDNITVVCADD